MYMRIGWIGLLVLLTACAAKLPEKSRISQQYNLKGVQTASVRTQCNRVQTSDLDKSFVQLYCESLHSGLKLALKREFPHFQLVDGDADLNFDFNLEQLHGGSAAARFWIGFGAGRSVTTVYLTMKRGDKVILEKRITETTTMPDIIGDTYSNEDALVRDIGLLSKKIAQYIKDPSSRDQEEGKDGTY